MQGIHVLVFYIFVTHETLLVDTRFQCSTYTVMKLSVSSVRKTILLIHSYSPLSLFLLLLLLPRIS